MNNRDALFIASQISPRDTDCHLVSVKCQYRFCTAVEQCACMAAGTESAINNTLRRQQSVKNFI